MDGCNKGFGLPVGARKVEKRRDHAFGVAGTAVYHA